MNLSSPRSRAAAAAAGLTVLLTAAIAPALAHESVPRAPEKWNVNQRLFIADSDNGSVVVLDDGVVRQRISTPPSILSLGRSADGNWLVAERGRNTDRDHVSFIDTGYDESTGVARRPYVARTWLTTSPSGVEGGDAFQLGSKLALPVESSGRLQLIDPGQLTGLGSADAGGYSLGAPSHYALVTTAAADGTPLLHVGAISGTTSVLNAATGAKLAAAGGCPALHGGIATANGKQVLFGCANGLDVVPADPTTGTATSVVKYPSDTRIAGFRRGAGNVVWGFTEGATQVLDRVDTSGPTPAITEIALGTKRQTRTLIAIAVSTDGSRLYTLTHQGYLQQRDGSTGALIRETKVMPSISTDIDETVERAILPGLAVADDRVYVSVPDLGRVRSVSVDRLRILQDIRVGGEPTRLVLLERQN